MKTFDFYEFTSILVPGALLIVGCLPLYPDAAAFYTASGISLGGFGVLVIIAYAAGHIVQGIGNAIEGVFWWFFSGKPSDWVRSNKRLLIAPAQAAQLESDIFKKLELNVELPKLSQVEWYAITRQINAAVANQGRSSKIEVFLGTYGLHRGLAAALLTVFAAWLISDTNSWAALTLITLPGVGFALARMYRFGVYYARELMIQFLELPLPAERLDSVAR
jgi:hypothetical protein